MKKGDFPYQKEAEEFIRQSYYDKERAIPPAVHMTTGARASGRKIGIFEGSISLHDYFVLCAEQAEALSDDELITYAFCMRLDLPANCHAWHALEFVLLIRGITLQTVNDQQNPAPVQTPDPISTDVP
jgi:hypothetical protein